MNTFPELTVPPLPRPPADADGFASTLWAMVPATAVACFHARSSDHHPRVQVRVAYTAKALHLAWLVEDRYVVSRITADNGSVCTDSCVECFVAPLPGRGHVNVEVNAGGVALASHVTALTPFTCRQLPPGDMARIRRHGSLPARIDPELAGPCTWEMAVDLPFDLLSACYGVEVAPVGTWRANLFKCADRSSHPHWASWAPIGELLSFHQGDRFGLWRFGR